MNFVIFIHRKFAHNWVLLRMAAEEFYFKQPFDVKGEYTIMKSIMTLALLPICILATFLYSRIINQIAFQQP